MGTRKHHDSGWNAAVAAVLRGERAAADLSMRELAEVSGIAYNSLQRYLAADRAIDVETLYAIATSLDTTPGEVMRRAQERLERLTDPPAFDQAAYDAVRAERPIAAAARRSTAADRHASDGEGRKTSGG